MSFTEREQSELLLSRIGDAFWFVFTEEERARSPEFEQEIREREGKIAADQARISEIESSTNGWDELEVTVLQGRINVSWKEVIHAYEERGSFADRKCMQFMALIFPVFGLPDFPGRQDRDVELAMELLLHPSTAN